MQAGRLAPRWRFLPEPSVCDEQGRGPMLFFGTRYVVFVHCVPWALQISRQSIDALKDWFRDEMQKSDWQLIVELKKVFEII